MCNVLWSVLLLFANTDFGSDFLLSRRRLCLKHWGLILKEYIIDCSPITQQCWRVAWSFGGLSTWWQERQEAVFSDKITLALVNCTTLDLFQAFLWECNIVLCYWMSEPLSVSEKNCCEMITDFFICELLNFVTDSRRYKGGVFYWMVRSKFSSDGRIHPRIGTNYQLLCIAQEYTT